MGVLGWGPILSSLFSTDLSILNAVHHQQLDSLMEEDEPDVSKSVNGDALDHNELVI